MFSHLYYVLTDILPMAITSANDTVTLCGCKHLPLWQFHQPTQKKATYQVVLTSTTFKMATTSATLLNMISTSN